jgi:DNA polymerase I
VVDLPFDEIWCVDFEFRAPAGERPDPVCLCAHEIRTGRRVRLWWDEFDTVPPYSIGPNSLFVAYFASADLGCHLVLGWPTPARIPDPFAEFRCLTNGLETVAGNGLLGALAHHGLNSMGACEKDVGRQLVMRGGPWSADERNRILDYCQADVDALARLLVAMSSGIDLPRALLRGRYMAAVAAMEWNGTPVDTSTLELLRDRWAGIQDQLIGEIDADYGVYEGRTFKADRFEAWLARHGIPWPRLDSGRLELGDGTFRQAARVYPAVSPLRELRSSLSDMRLQDLAVGRDGRNRTLLSPFGASSGRNTPSNSRFIFGPSVWLRGLIKPPPGYGVAYIDWQQQEFGIAAALSRDPAMLSAYRSGDPYLAFAKQAGAVPQDATKISHGSERELFKTCALGVQYGMGPDALAQRVGGTPIVGRELLLAHKSTYPGFWAWSDAAVDRATLLGSLHTVFGWRVHTGADFNPRSLRNFPMQANGAEMLRLACSLATERGVEVCAPVHDAVLIAAPLDQLDQNIATMREAMAEASRAVLADLELGTDVAVVAYPDRYRDKRGVVMWDRVMKLIQGTGQREAAA